MAGEQIIFYRLPLTGEWPAEPEGLQTHTKPDGVLVPASAFANVAAGTHGYGARSCQLKAGICGFRRTRKF